MTTTAHVYGAICEVTSAMASEGIGKTRRNEAQGYKFRSVDDVYAAIGRLLATHKLCMLPRVRERTMVERATKNGGTSTYTTLLVDFDIVSAVDGSHHTITTVGEAMDSADKSSNKAMSAAFKYACFLAFQIPTEGDNDTDASHLEKALGDSVAWGEWEASIAAALRTSKTMGALHEAWSAAADRGKEAPNGTMKRLSSVKDEMKSKLAPPNGEARS